MDCKVKWLIAALRKLQVTLLAPPSIAVCWVQAHASLFTTCQCNASRTTPASCLHFTLIIRQLVHPRV